jgi:phage terminase large subunit
MTEALDGDVIQPRRVVIPYSPRKHFIPVHKSRKRWRHIVAHRRCGKSVFEVNELGALALTNPRQDPPPRYAYVGPSFTQAKDLVWGYCKHFFAPIPGVSFSESELAVTFPNRARLQLYGGASSYERMRGLYFDGIAMDEYAMLHPDAFNSVVRPALSDYRGRAIISGTSNGSDHFYEMRRIAEANPEDWDWFDLKVTETDALHPDEVAQMRREMSASAFAREMLNSFEAAVEGAYYETELNDMQVEGRICPCPYDPLYPVMTWWDLGMRDTMSVWFVQRAGRELRIIDYMENVGKGLDWYVKELNAKPYNFSTHILPHDVKVRELIGGSRYNYLIEQRIHGQLMDVTIAPNHRVDDGIQCVRTTLPICIFSTNKAVQKGLAAMRAYQTQHNAKLKTNAPKPLHNWASHAADAFRTGCMGLPAVVGWGSGTSSYGGISGAIRRRIRGII